MKRQKCQRGSTIVESVIVIIIVTMIFFGLLQVSLLINARQILDYTAFATARSKTVGFHDGIVYKAFRVANIPNAGKMRIPFQGLNSRAQLAVEKERIPWYLEGVAALDYENWDDITFTYPVLGDDYLVVSTQQPYPLAMPFHRLFYARDYLWLGGSAGMENHYPYYLQRP
jgi:hypothetical protein